MRQLGHIVVGLAFWALLVVLWILLVLERKAGGASLVYSVQYVCAVGGAVLAVTTWWIRHNTRIYKRKGPRTGRPSVPPRLDEDRLGRAIRWQNEGGAEGALEITHLRVELDGAAKVYVEAA
jgi:hypothetical protein